jgi:hypothetical protein
VDRVVPRDRLKDFVTACLEWMLPARD